MNYISWTLLMFPTHHKTLFCLLLRMADIQVLFGHVDCQWCTLNDILMQFLCSLSSFKNIWHTFFFCWAFRMTLFLTSCTTLQFKNWANINFGPCTLLLVWVISLPVTLCALLICISISSYVYGRLASVVKNSANIFGCILPSFVWFLVCVFED